MKTWIKRTLIATAGAALLLGGLTACGTHGGRHGEWNEARVTEMRGKAIERISGKLELDTAQKAKLETLADAMLAQRQALRGEGGGHPRDALKPLIAGEKFDRVQAQALLQAKTAAVQGQGPKVVDALADFYDSLKPAQQAQVRAMLDKRGHGWGWRG